MNTQYRKNLKAVAQACKDYTDNKIKKVYYDIGHNDITTDDHINEPTYRFTAPANAKLLMLQSIGGNTVKLSPSVASDSTKAMIKTMPSTVYTFDGSKFYGDSEVSENLIVLSDVTETTTNGITWKVENGVITINGTSTSSVTIDLPIDIPNGTYSLGYFNDFTISWSYLQASLMYNSTYIQQNSLAVENAKQSNISATNGINRIRLYIISSGTSINGSLKPMLIKGSTAPTEFKAGFSGIHNIELSGLVVKNSDDEVMQTKTIDLTTIVDSNNNKLFPNGKLMGNENVKDVLGVYNQESKWDEVDLGLQTIEATGIDTHTFKITLSSAKAPSDNDTLAKLLMANYEAVTYNSISTSGDMTMALRSDNVFVIRNNAYSTAEAFKTAMSGVMLQYERNTYLTSNTDLSATLRNIQGYPNGSIIAENTNNMDVESVITYNSIIQETLCPSITITRNGVDILTRNLPTQASDGYGVNANAHNLRVFSDYEGNAVNKRYTNVNKGDMGTPTWNYNSTAQQFSTSVINDLKLGNWQVAGNILCKPYTTIAGTNLSSSDMCIALNDSTQNIFAKDSKYTDGATFKLANTNEPLYYELADTSKTETDMDDFDYFFDVEEGDVITLNNPYAQQVYATYSFLIKEAKSNE